VLAFKDYGELGDDFQSRIAGPVFEFAHVGAVDPRLMGEVLLRDPSRASTGADWRGEGLPEVHPTV
jgi:hypothetical protein